MLYELLAGRLPLDPDEVGLRAFMLRLTIRATEPPLPSASSCRSCTTARRWRRSGGPTRRPPTAAQGRSRLDRYEGDGEGPQPSLCEAQELATDLARHLAHEPVQARPPTATYRLRKFVRRHRLAVAAGAAVVLALLGGVAAATLGFVRATRANALAREEAATARQVSSFLVDLFKVSDPMKARGSAVTAREILDSGAKKLETELAAQPRVQARLMNTIGDVYRALGLYPQSERLLTRSLATRERLGRGDPAELAQGMTSLGQLYVAQGRYAEAETTLRRAARLAAHLPESSTQSLRALSDLYRQTGRYAESDSLVRVRVAALEQALGPEHEQVLDALATLGSSQAEQGRSAAAESLFRRIIAIRERQGDTDPLLARSFSSLASALFEQHRIDEAESLYRRAFDADTVIYGPVHTVVGIQLYNLANVESERGRSAEAIVLFGRAQAIFEQTGGADHPYVASTLTAIAHEYAVLHRYAEALPMLRRALAIREKTLAPDHPFIGTTYHELGETELRLRRFPDAEANLRRALAIREKSLEPTSFYTAQTLDALAELYRETQRYDRAEEMYRRAMKQWEGSGREDAIAMRTATARNYAEMLRRQGRGAEAAALGR